MTQRPVALPLGRRMVSDLIQTPLFGLATIGFGSLSIASSFLDKQGSLQHKIARAWAKTTVRISLSRLTIIGAENFKKAPVAVYASNHTSYMDTPVLFAALPFQFRILAKQQLWKVPFIGWHLDRSGQIPVDISTQRSAISSLGAGVRALKAGMPLVVFPEAAVRRRDIRKIFRAERHSWRFARRCHWFRWLWWEFTGCCRYIRGNFILGHLS
jgi:1-acyl-sn-glycerol-3-phosphate acyltransferase